ncbi:MAG: ribonuclease HI family protein [Candidatus Micrarchaeales archaeon]
MAFYVYTDGAARGNPGPSASGYLVLDEKRKLIVKNSFYNGKQTNNIAEYLAIIAALKKVHSEYGSSASILLYSDSELVVNQLTMNYKVRDKKLKALHSEALKLALKFTGCKFANVRREDKYVSMVDRELNELLDSIKKDDNDIRMLKKSRTGSQKELFG